MRLWLESLMTKSGSMLLLKLILGVIFFIHGGQKSTWAFWRQRGGDSAILLRDMGDSTGVDMSCGIHRIHWRHLSHTRYFHAGIRVLAGH